VVVVKIGTQLTVPMVVVEEEEGLTTQLAYYPGMEALVATTVPVVPPVVPLIHMPILEQVAQARKALLSLRITHSSWANTIYSSWVSGRFLVQYNSSYDLESTRFAGTRPRRSRNYHRVSRTATWRKLIRILVHTRLIGGMRFEYRVSNCRQCRVQ
jgi:hypothetical protein